MIKNFLFIFLAVLVCSTACKTDKNQPNVDNLVVSFDFKQLHSDLPSFHDSIMTGNIVEIKKKYGSFFELYCRNMLHLAAPNDSMQAQLLNGFLSDKDIKNVYEKVNEVFTDSEIEAIKTGLTGFFKHLKYYYPEKHIPNVVTYVSGFNYNIVTTDSVLGIGLDMYLGGNSEFYPSLSFPQYMFRKFSKEYIVRDCIKGWFQSEHDIEGVKKELLSQMIYLGKMQYYIDVMAPQMADTIKIGFTHQQFDWCTKNEEQMWAYFIEKKMLYSTNEKEYIRFVQDGATTQGFPEGSPGNTGAYIGWQIVNAYMKNNEVTLQQLLAENDAQKILTQSGYKPK